MRLIARLAVVPLLVVIAGCGSGSNGPGLTLSPGNWQITGVSASNPGRGNIGGGAVFNQNGASVSGIMHLVSANCFHVIEDIDINGSVSGSTLTFTSAAVNGQAISASAAGSGTSLTGSYNLSAAPCGPADQGTLTATLVPPATGTWQGTLTSSSGAVTQITAILNQSGPDAHGRFLVSGPVTLTGATCLPSGTITDGLAVGAIYVMDVQTTTPGVLDVLIAATMTDPATATSMSGIYSAFGSTCTDRGTVRLSKS